ncbi:MAG: LPS export ABC transporter periplasmic protein LptC [Rhodocyclaceae bacterium]|nr:LPS export ABC transporter periplasmic protein LptC [Rhodocyclaceae bacterium]
MRLSASALFPLVLAGLLAGLSYWLERATTVEEQTRRAKARHAPDFVVDKVRLQRFDASGALLQSLHATQMSHFPDDESTAIIAPTLTYHRPDAPTRITAKQALMTRDGKEVRLTGTVRVSRPKTPSRESTLIETEALTVFPEEERAVGNSPVTLIQGGNVIKGGAITYYGKERIAELSGGVRGSFRRGQSE